MYRKFDAEHGVGYLLQHLCVRVCAVLEQKSHCAK